MKDFLSIASGITTPLSLAALGLLVVYGLYKVVFEKLLAERLGPTHTFRLFKSGMTYVFVLALVLVGLLILIYGAIAIIGALQDGELPKRQAELEQGLHSPHLSDRIAAIGGLAQIARKSPARADAICDIIASRVRETAGTEKVPRQRLESDLNAAVVTLSVLASQGNCKKVDLSGSHLMRLALAGGSLSGSKLTGAQLDEADLSGSDLSGANLIGADLDGVQLIGAVLTGAELGGATFVEADLTDANLTGAEGLAKANFSNAWLQKAVLDDVDLTGAWLPTGDGMKGVSLVGTNLSGVDMSRVTGICRNVIDKASVPPAHYPTSEECT